MRTLFIVFFLSFSAFAQVEGNPENWCREEFFTRDSGDFTIASVRGAKNRKAHFHGDEKENCPGSPGCLRRSFLVGGDEVVVNRSRGDFSCAWYVGKNGRSTVGWLKTSDLKFSEMLLDAAPKAWVGEWVYGDNGIEFTENKLEGFLNVAGNATWIGVGGNVHVGEIDGRYAPENGIIKYSDGDDEYDCKMTMRLLGRYLIVADNLKCGGVNVTFSGIYTKRKK